MNRKWVLVSVLFLVAVGGVILLQQCMCAAPGPARPAAGPPSSEPTKPASQPVSRPTSAPVLLATVGDKKITSEAVEKILAKAPAEVPAEQLTGYRENLLKQETKRRIFEELIRSYAAAKKITCSEEEFKAEKAKIAEYAKDGNMTADQMMAEQNITVDMIRDQVVRTKLLDQACSKEKVDSFVKAHPSYFDGTTVGASHILVKCDPIASTSEQKAALEKIEKIAADVKAGKAKFEDAARQFSDCPSKDSGGWLKPFQFGAMDPAFSQTAFELKIGEFSGIVRSQFGYHLIKVTGRLEGLGKPVKDAKEEGPEESARQCLQSALVSEIVAQAVTTCPIVIEKR